MHCTFEDFMPGSDNDAEPNRTYDEYFSQFRGNALAAGRLLFGGDFDVKSSAIAKVEGDVFELLEAGAFWNAAAAWNRFMDFGTWDSAAFTCPVEAVRTPTRKVAIVKLPRGYDATRLFEPNVRGSIEAFERALELRGMSLGLSSPDIVGVRLPHPLPDTLQRFLNPVDNLNEANLEFLETAHRLLEGRVEGTGFLFAVAVKRTTRSDRLYQPLFEANTLKYLIESVLRGAAFRFYAHLNSFEGADVEGAYKAASLMSLIRGGTPARAVDVLYLAERPRDAAQSILNDLPLFPV
ncbi:restriction endonuclease [Burkholderia cepacia]|nr:restriction endonuclease [Burkholderia cepacia]